MSNAVNAKNCFRIVEVFNSYQLVYGRNPDLPCTLSDNFLQWKALLLMKWLLNIFHWRRKAFIPDETFDKTRNITTIGRVCKMEAKSILRDKSQRNGKGQL